MSNTAGQRLQRALTGVVMTIKRIDYEKLAGRALEGVLKLKTGSLHTFHRGRLLLTGPIRNGIYVSRQFVTLIARERQLSFPQKNLWPLARTEYAAALERIFPTKLRGEGQWINAIKGFLAQTSWRQMGNGTLIFAELLSLYYMSKLVFLSARKTFKTLF